MISAAQGSNAVPPTLQVNMLCTSKFGQIDFCIQSMFFSPDLPSTGNIVELEMIAGGHIPIISPGEGTTIEYKEPDSSDRSGGATGGW
jgi:hypothetical protein